MQPGNVSQHTTRLLPEPGLRASSPPGPILLLLDFFRPPLPAKEEATSTVMFSLSILLRTGEWPVDLRGRRVEGTVASAWPDMVAAAMATQLSLQGKASPRGNVSHGMFRFQRA